METTLLRIPAGDAASLSHPFARFVEFVSYLRDAPVLWEYLFFFGCIILFLFPVKSLFLNVPLSFCNPILSITLYWSRIFTTFLVFLVFSLILLNVFLPFVSNLSVLLLKFALISWTCFLFSISFSEILNKVDFWRWYNV